MIHYLVYGQHSIRTALRNISHFDCPDYVSNVEAGINSTLSAEFKKAFMIAYQEFAALNPNVELSITPLQLFSNGNQLVKQLYDITRKPVVTGRKLILFLSIFGSLFYRIKKNYPSQPKKQPN